MTVSQLTSRSAVLHAIAEADRLGRDDFLRTYGYGPATRYMLRYDGKSYDSKAIAGVAWGLQLHGDGHRRPESFQGGAGSTVPTLRKLGFEIVEGGGSLGQGRRRPTGNDAAHPRDPSSFRPRPFDPDRKPATRRAAAPPDEESRRVAHEQANRRHQAILAIFGQALQAAGWSDLEEMDGAIDLMAVQPGEGTRRRVIFEMKSLSAKSERRAVRGGLAQLLEYRLVHGSPEDRLCLVTNRPVDDRRLALLDSLGIGHACVVEGQITISETKASRIVFPNSTRRKFGTVPRETPGDTS